MGAPSFLGFLAAALLASATSAEPLFCQIGSAEVGGPQIFVSGVSADGSTVVGGGFPVFVPPGGTFFGPMR